MSTDTAAKPMDAAERATDPIALKLAGLLDTGVSAEQAYAILGVIQEIKQAARLDEREKALEEAIPEKWPVRGPDFNSWNADAAKFLKIVQSNPNLWLKNSQLKYLILRVDTRPGCHFMVEDRDGNKIPADAVMAAIRALKAKA